MLLDTVSIMPISLDTKYIFHFPFACKKNETEKQSAAGIAADDSKVSCYVVMARNQRNRKTERESERDGGRAGDEVKYIFY